MENEWQEAIISRYIPFEDMVCDEDDEENALQVPGNVNDVLFTAYISYYPLNHRWGCHASQ